MIILLVTSYHKVEHFPSKLNTCSSQYTSAVYKKGRKRTYLIARRMASRTVCLKWLYVPRIGLHTHTQIYIYIYQTYTLNEIWKRPVHPSSRVLCSKQHISTETEGNLGRGKYYQSNKLELFHTICEIYAWKTNKNELINK